MKITLKIPPLTTLASLDVIAKNVRQSHLRANSMLQEGVVEIERVEGEVHWRQGADVLVFSVDRTSDVGLVSLENAGNRFVAATITWNEDGEPLRYRLITSHESEADWTRSVATQIAELLDKKLKEG